MSDKIIISNVEMKNKGFLVLQCDVEIVPWCIIFREIRYFEKGESRWICMPSRSWKDTEDQWNHKDLVVFKDSESKERFRKTVCEMIQKIVSEMPKKEIEFDEELPF